MKILAKIFTVALLFVATFMAQAQQNIWTVANSNDSGSGSLRQAIIDASPGDIIKLPSSVPTITLNSSITINKPLTIEGSKIIGRTTVRLAANLTGNVLEYTFTGTGTLNLKWLIVGGGTNSFYTDNTNANINFDECIFEKYTYLGRVGKAVISNCKFLNTGHGLYLQTLTPLDNSNSYVINNSEFTNNLGNGSALTMVSNGSGTQSITIKVNKCKFYNNRTGNGVMYLALSSATHLYVNECTFDDNTSTIDNNATAINSIGFSPKITISNSFFRGNTKDIPVITDGYLIYSSSISETNFYQNVITGNNGSHIKINGNLTLVQNTIAHNYGATLTAGNLQVGNSILAGINYNITNNPFSFGGNYIGMTTTWNNGNDITTPATLAFVSPVTTIPSSAGNYRLQSNSSCLGVGINANIPQDLFDRDNDGNTTEAMPLDIAGNVRIARHVLFSPLTVDIGAYERQANGGGLRAENTAETLTNNPQTVVYPNPANEVLNINFELSTGADKAEIAIFNAIGQVVYQNTVNAESKTLKVDVSSFEKGLYFVKIADNQGNTQNQKVVVQ